MRKHKPKAIFIPVIGLAAFAGILFVIFYSVEWAAKKSDFFKIKEIIINSNDGAKIGLDYLKGRDIFTLNLKEEKDSALRIYPVCKTIKLIKILPNRIFVDFVIRKPIAYVRLYKYFYVDEDGMLFDISLGLGQFDGSASSLDFARDNPERVKRVEGATINPERSRRIELPVILGLDARIFGPKSGQRYEVKELSAALEIIKDIKRNTILSNLIIKKVDAADLGNISVFLTLPSAAVNDAVDKITEFSDILEVKFGQGYINEKVDILGNLFVQGRNDLGDIKYIDLRFNDPVIKFKEQ